MTCKVVEPKANLPILITKNFVVVFDPSVFCIRIQHELLRVRAYCSNSSAVIQAVLLLRYQKPCCSGVLFQKHRGCFDLPMKKNGPFFSTGRIAHEPNCNAGFIRLLPWHLFCPKATIRWCTGVNKSALKIRCTKIHYNPNNPDSSKLR